MMARPNGLWYSGGALAALAALLTVLTLLGILPWATRAELLTLKGDVVTRLDRLEQKMDRLLERTR